MGLVAEESEHWLDVLEAGGLVQGDTLKKELEYLYGESTELRAIFVASYKTAKANYERMIADKRARRASTAKPGKSSNP